MIVTSSAFPLFYSKYTNQEQSAEDPISNVDLVTLTDALRSMKESISQDWRLQGEGMEETENRDDEQKQWSDRVEDAILMCNVYSALTPADAQFLYQVDGVPVGVITMDRRHQAINTPYIQVFVTHPGSSGAGAALLEQAVKKSIEYGGLGQLLVSPIDSSSPAYEALGFSKIAGGLLLDPAKSEKWQLFGDAWRLINSVGELKTG